MTDPIFIGERPNCDPQLLALVEKLLDDIRAGRVSTVALITVSPLGAIGTPAYGPRMADLYLGTGLFQKMLIDHVTRQTSASPIIRM